MFKRTSMYDPKIDIKEKKLLSNNHYILHKYAIKYTKKDGSSEIQEREVYDKGSGAAILLYNKEKQTIILTRQFRLAIYLNEGKKRGMSIEVCAGLLDGLSPTDCIIKETLEETGYKIHHPKYLYDAYMTPGAVMEKVSYFIAPYDETMKISQGGGLASEQEEIEVLEIKFDDAYKMLEEGKIIDGKTIMLLQYALIHIFNKHLKC